MLTLCLRQLSIGVSVLCVPVLRWTQPNLPRPLKVNLIFPILYIIATIFVTIVPMAANPIETGMFQFSIDVNNWKWGVINNRSWTLDFLSIFKSKGLYCNMILLKIILHFVLGYGILMILSSVPVYLVFISWKSKPKCFQKAVGEWNFLLRRKKTCSTWILRILFFVAEKQIELFCINLKFLETRSFIFEFYK